MVQLRSADGIAAGLHDGSARVSRCHGFTVAQTGWPRKEKDHALPGAMPSDRSMVV